MSSPQAENGHIDIANEIAEQLARTQLSGYESRVLWVLWRKTYGWHKKNDRISISQFSQATGIARRHIHKTLERLVNRNIVTKNGNSFITRWAFQKDYSKWKIITKIGNKFNNKNKPLPIPTVTVTKNGNKLVTKNGAYKRKERNNTKERSTIMSQIETLTSQFPSNIQSLIKEYTDIARLQNKTEKMSLRKKLRLTNELHFLWSQYEGNEIDETDFKQALKTTVSNEAPNINYVRKVIQGIIRKRSVRLKRGRR